MQTVDEWSFAIYPNMFIKPNEDKLFIVGTVGDTIKIIPNIIKILEKGKIILTETGTHYKLGSPCKKYVAWVKANNINMSEYIKRDG